MWRGLSPLLNIENSRTMQYQQPVQKIKRHIIMKRRHLFYNYWIGRIAKKSPPKIISASKVLVILPPFFCNAPSSDYFDFTSRLLSWEHTLIRLQSLHAFTSTLGGGYFLCRQLHVATELARYQRRIATALNDEHAAGVCTVNEAYNYIHAGYIRHALAILKKTKIHAKKRNDNSLMAIISSACTFAKRVRRFHAAKNYSLARKTKTCDDYHRIRIV